MSDREDELETLQRAVEGDNEVDRARALVKLGGYRIEEGDFNAADGYFGSAADIFQVHDLPVERAYALRCLADSLKRQGRTEEAVLSYQVVIDLASEVNDAESKAFAAGPMAYALRELHRIDESFDAHHIALEAFGELDAPYPIGLSLVGIGEIHYGRNQLKLAAEYATRAYNQFQMAGNPFRAATAKDLLADALAGLGQFEEALANRNDVFNIMLQICEDDATNNAAFAKGMLLLEWGRNTEAAELLGKVTIDYRRQQEFTDSANAELGMVVAQFRNDLLGSWGTTREALFRLRSYYDAAGLGVQVIKTERFMAEWYALQEAWPKAVTVLRHAVTRCQELCEPGLERSTRARLADALIEIGEYEEASRVLAEVDESLWGDVALEIKYLREVREKLEIRLTPEAD